ncbi:MAG: NERD domain-containing protein [Bacillus sp. (in: Bacteria)]|nr:NERD domain-containing protein [Bacillus sp. (in: firmicutes)]
MPFKSRFEPDELKILRVLNTLMDFTAKEKQYYLNLEKDFEGEVMFDLLTEELQSDCFIINDLLLEFNNTIFQIDTLIIFQEALSLFEVKNYEGDFYYQSERFYTKSGTEIKNPLLQLERSESLLRQLLQKLGLNLPIVANVVFINPEFTLYQAPLNEPIIFPNQLNHFMKKLDKNPSKLNERHRRLADKLVSLHLPESPYTRLPPYHYDRLKKSMICGECHSFSISIGERKIVCNECGCEEGVESAVMRSVEELKLLFPDKRITTNVVYEWCRVVESKKTIRRILKQNYIAIGKREYSFSK